jgi:hypothetical protein
LQGKHNFQEKGERMSEKNMIEDIFTRLERASQRAEALANSVLKMIEELEKKRNWTKEYLKGGENE